MKNDNAKRRERKGEEENVSAKRVQPDGIKQSSERQRKERVLSKTIKGLHILKQTHRKGELLKDQTQ